MLELKKNIDTFKNNHPKFFGFLGAVKNKGLREGTIYEIKVTTPEGETLETAIKLQQSDIDALSALMTIAKPN